MSDQIEATHNQIAAWAVQEILRAKARWLHICYATIMPPELYKKAASETSLRECTEWAKREGYVMREFRDQSHLEKHGLTVAWFKPVLVGEKENRHIEFDAVVNGVRVELVDPSLN